MSQIMISVAIPYSDRMENLKLCLASLARQTLPAHAFEVVIGSMDYDPALVVECRTWLDRLNIVLVISPRPFEIPAARNLAMRAISGELCLQMDADSFLHEGALGRLYERYCASGGRTCILGEVLGYGNNNEDDLKAFEVPSFDSCERWLDGLIQSRALTPDLRRTTPHAIPWSFVWTGFAAVPAATVRAGELYFDEEFVGWGVDDLEWGYRLRMAGLGIDLADDLFALHLPHRRSMADNKVTEAANFRRLLAKWPKPDVELVAAFNDIQANRLFIDYQRECRALLCRAGGRLGSAIITRAGRNTLVLAAELDEGGGLAGSTASLAKGGVVTPHPCLGLAVPFEDGAFDYCVVGPSAAGLGEPFRSRMAEEAQRVCSSKPVWMSL